MGIVIERGICGHEDCGECTIGRPLADLVFYKKNGILNAVTELNLSSRVTEKLKETDCDVPFAAVAIHSSSTRLDASYFCSDNAVRCQYLLRRESEELEEWKFLAQAARVYVDSLKR